MIDLLTTRRVSCILGLMKTVTREMDITEVRPGMEIWEGEAWSSHGMKEGFWSLVEKTDTTNDLIDYFGKGTVLVRFSEHYAKNRGWV